VPGAITFSRGTAGSTPVTVRYLIGGTATQTADYTTLAGSATIPQGATSVTVPIVPLDDAVVETNESVILTLTQGSGYVIGTPASATVTIVSDDVAPDMTVPALTVPRAGAEGGPLDLVHTTRNQGLGDAPSSQTSFYLSRNAILDAADTVLGTYAAAPLPAGESATATTAVVLPAPLAAGTYYVFAKADAPNAIFETNEFNNTRITTIAIGPDLVVSSLSAPATAGPGSTILVSDTTTNQGAGAAGATTTRFFLSADVFLDAGDTPLQARAVPALAAGATSTGPTSITIPASTSSGTYYLFAQADAANAVVEANDANNAKSALLRIGADLTVSAIVAPTRAASGGTIAVTDTTRNVGSGAAAASTTAFYLSTNFVLDAGDFRLGTGRPVPALASNEQHTGTTTLTLPGVAPGSWILIANADDGSSVVETQETNNTRFAILQVGPDLNFLMVSAPSSGAAGGPVVVNTTVRNSGGGAAPPSIVRFYLSSDAMLDASDTALSATRDVPALAMDGSHAASTTVVLPTNRTGGHYLLFVADGAQTVAESNEINNVSARFIQVNQ
jgi:subtilase family serine protease